MAEKILAWISRHSILKSNHEILKKAFGAYKVYQYSKHVYNVLDIIDFADLVGADAYIVVLPDVLIHELMKKDKRPVYRFTVKRLFHRGHVYFIPTGLEQIIKYEIELKRIV